MCYLKKIATLTAIMCFLQSNCCANGIYSVKYDSGTGMVSIAGNTSQADIPVTLMLLKQGNSIDVMENMTPEAADSVVLRYDQISSNEEGDFVFTFKLPNDASTGEYATRLAWGGSFADNRLVYISPDDFANALSDINNAATKEDMITALDNCILYFGFDNTYYAGLSAKEKAFMAGKLLNERGMGYSSATEIGVVFSEAMAIAAVNEIALGNDAIETVNHFEDVLKLKELGTYQTFNRQTDLLKKKIIEAVASEGRVDDIDTYRKRFEERTVVISLNNIRGYDEVQEILQDNNHILDIDFTDYNKLTNKSAVNRNMTGKSFNSTSEIVTAFNSYVRSEKNKENTTSNTGTGNGGGGGGNGSLLSPPSGMGTGSKPSGANNAKSSPAIVFKDLGTVEWARSSIERLASRNIISGRGNNNFEPTAEVTRAEFIKMLVSLLGIEDDEAKCDFADVEASAWYYAYVASAVKYNLTSGIGDSLFGSNNKITKQDMATLIVRAGELKAMNFNDSEGKHFNDEAEISSYALESVKKLSAVGVISGTDNGCFEPKKSATRAEAAVMLTKFLDLLEDK